MDYIKKVIEAFAFEGVPEDSQTYGNGHINDTMLVLCRNAGARKRYILQRINTAIFQNPDALMRNIEGVTGFLRKKIIAAGGDPDRETLNLVRTKDGRLYYRCDDGSCWRAYLFIEGAACYDEVRKPEDFYRTGKAFGRFQRMLADYPAGQLAETIPDFHNTPARFEAFRQAVKKDICGRKGTAEKEIEFILDRQSDMGVIQEMIERGELPLRVTHNDTKLNNIMIDDTTGEAICVLDLDTVMPGTSVFDFGDSIRFGANTAAEDETDLGKVSLSLPLFTCYAKGFLAGCEGSLTANEIAMLPMGAKLMTLECGMRFLTDYLQGDVYFKIHRENHNLDRARNQLALVADMEKKWEQMEEAVSAALRDSSFPAASPEETPGSCAPLR